MLLRLFCFLLFALASLHIHAEARLLLNPDTKRLDLAPRMSILRDAAGTLDPTTVLPSNDWRTLAGSFNVGFTQDAIWLRVDVEQSPASVRQWILEVNNAVFDDVRLFLRAQDGNWIEHRAGEDIPREQWDFSYRNPVFRFSLAEPGPNTLLLKITSRNSISAQITLWDPEFFAEASRTESLAYGLLLGAYITIIIFHLFFWRWTREPVNGWYAAYVIDSCFHVALSFGFIQQYTGLPGRISDAILAVLIGGSLWLGAKLCTDVLELAPRMPRTSRWLIRTAAAVSLISVTLSLTVNYATGVAPAQLVGFVEVLVLIVVSLRLLLRGHQPAAFFLAAYGLYFIGILLRVARNFTLLPPTLLTDNSFQIAAIGHMVLMSLAVINRYNNIKLAAERVQAEALRLKTDYAENLEKEVTIRTSSLSAEISRRKMLEEHLQKNLDVEKQTRQEQREFVSMVSHEFRTPLAIIDTSAQRIAGSENATTTQERCRNIREATKRMTRLMDEFLSQDRLDGDLITFAAKAEDSTMIVQGAAAEWDASRLEVICKDLPKQIACDDGLLRVALRNLIANAMRHSPENTLVQLYAQGQSDGGVTFEIVDSGCGIPSDEIPKLFQKYFRGRNSQGQPGAGLGLYLVKRIAQLHGGSINVTSAPTGSHFELSIPAHRENVTHSDQTLLHP